MRNFGIIGFPLEHSFSEKYFTEKFSRENIEDCSFTAYALQSIEEFPKLIRTVKLDGLSVTIPFKEAIIPYLDYIDDEAKAVGAVNCIKFDHSKETPILSGYNTDVFGFETLLKKVRMPKQVKALVLGTGGASKAVVYVLNKLKIECSVVSRKPSSRELINYHEVNQDIMLSHLLIINTTPVGMFPDVKKCPDILYQFIHSEHVFVDLIYNPSRTLFLKIAEKQGVRITNGLNMLHAQADKSWEIWNK